MKCGICGEEIEGRVCYEDDMPVCVDCYEHDREAD